MKRIICKLKLLSVAVVGTFCFISANVFASDYEIDKAGMHASITFKISHLGYSWIYGRFNDFSGSFSYDKANPDASKVAVTINTGSVDTNHAARDKHLRSDDFLNTEKFPQATFVSKSYKEGKDGSGVLVGDLTLHGVTKSITIKSQYIAEGKDPWGGYRAGFEGTANLSLADFGIVKDLGPKSKELSLILVVEGVRK